MRNWTDIYYNECRPENQMSNDWQRHGCGVRRVDYVDMCVMCGSHTVPEAWWSDEERQRVMVEKAERKQVLQYEDDRIQAMIADYEARKLS